MGGGSGVNCSFCPHEQQQATQLSLVLEFARIARRDAGKKSCRVLWFFSINYLRCVWSPPRVLSWVLGDVSLFYKSLLTPLDILDRLSALTGRYLANDQRKVSGRVKVAWARGDKAVR